MKKRLLVGCGLFAVALAMLVGAEWLGDPSRRWQPPAVELPVPNAFDDYQRAGALTGGERGFNKPEDDPYRNATVRRRILAENTEALQVLRAGFAHAYVQPPGQDFAAALKLYSPYTKLARLLAWEAIEAADQGRHAQSIASRLDAERLGFDMVRRADSVGMSHGTTIRLVARGEKDVQPTIDHLSAAEARAAATRLAGLLAGEQSLNQTFADERDIELARKADMVRSAGRFRLAKSFDEDEDSPRAALFMAVLGPGAWMGEYRRYMDALAAWSKLPWNAAPSPRPGRMFDMSRSAHFDFGRSVSFKYHAADAADQMFLAALALQAWHAEHGSYPDALDALVPNILTAVPLDPFGRGALKYRREGDTYVLYSVGPDGRDDGGEPAAVRDEKTGTWQYRTNSVECRGDMVWVTSPKLNNLSKP